MLNNLTFIGNRKLTIDHKSEMGQLAAKPLLMRIQNSAQHQFAAGVNDFDFHGGFTFAVRARTAKSKFSQARLERQAVDLAVCSNIISGDGSAAKIRSQKEIHGFP